MSERVAREFAPALDSVAECGRWVGATLTAHFTDAEACFQLELAAVELFSNIVRHGAPQAAILVVIVCAEWGAQIELVDDCEPFDMTRILPSAVPDASATSGRGLFIVRQVTDEFLYRRHAEHNAHSLYKMIG